VGADRYRVLNVVSVATGASVCEISWASRQELLRHLRATEDDTDAVRASFHAAATSRAVTLDDRGKRLLLDAIHAWAGEIGAHRLPTDVVMLEQQLAADLGLPEPKSEP
jgi:hypothetical protein